MPFVPKSRMSKRSATPTTDLAGEETTETTKATLRARSAIDLVRLRSVLLPVPGRSATVLGDADEANELDVESLIPAAVLFPIVLRESGPSVLLTQRADHLKHHPGQISFPGGRVEPGDSSPAETALRETAEEIGLAATHIEILGYLPEYRTITSYRVTPVVAVVAPPFSLALDPFEVAEAFEVPLAFLMDTANHQQHAQHYRGRLRQYIAMPYGNYFIWGATAGIILSLALALRD